MKIKTSRFGELEVNNKDVINFKSGILGFENHSKFFIVDPGDNTLILWLQSVDDEKIAFPILEPKIFNPEYSVKLVPSDLNSLELENLQNAKVYSVLTIPSDITTMSANLKAPIVINNSNSMGKQVVLQDSKLSVKFEMYKELKKYLVNFVSDDSKRTTVEEPKKEQESTTKEESAFNEKVYELKQ